MIISINLKNFSKRKKSKTKINMRLTLKILTLVGVIFSAISIVLFEYVKRPKIQEEIVHFGHKKIEFGFLEKDFNHPFILKLENKGKSTAKGIGYEIKFSTKIVKVKMQSSENSLNYRIRDNTGKGFNCIFIEINEFGKGGYFLISIFTEKPEASTPQTNRYIKVGNFI